MNLLLLFQDAFWSAIAALGFSVLFNVPRRMLAGGMICAAVGHAVRTFLMQAGLDIAPATLDIAPATLVGALMIGFLGIGFGRYWRAPSLIFTLSASVTLVPGVFAYRAMLGILRFLPAQTRRLAVRCWSKRRPMPSKPLSFWVRSVWVSLLPACCSCVKSRWCR